MKGRASHLPDFDLLRHFSLLHSHTNKIQPEHIFKGKVRISQTYQFENICTWFRWFYMV